MIAALTIWDVAVAAGVLAALCSAAVLAAAFVAFGVDEVRYRRARRRALRRAEEVWGAGRR